MISAPEPLPSDFLLELQDLEKAYLAENDPIRQSGFHGGEIRWRTERELILDAIDGDGDFLDIGCANGYLLECLVEWGKGRGVEFTPYGVDQGSGLIKLAKRRFPQYVDHFWNANAWDWHPPRKFRYVYTLHDCVPESYLSTFIEKILERFVENDGTLIVGAYGSTSERKPALDITDVLHHFNFPVTGSASRGDLPVSRIAWIRAQRSKTRNP